MRSGLERGFALLEQAARILRIPRYFAHPEHGALFNNWFQTPCEQSRKRVYDWPDGGTPWSNSDLITSIHGENRPNLYIGGFWLDDSVTFAGLNALADGYDTYLLTDVSVARYPETREPAIDRLIQAGVVPTTTLQIASEWMAEAHDTGMQAKLSQLIFRSLP
ncbi:MAG: isochorismatase family protein [Kiloniellales bacterium]|nr:isochorismatase family protein [Kiloniellales bacterium]